MDLTHGSVWRGEEELLSDVPMYISADSDVADRDYVSWGGCLHLERGAGPVLEAGEVDSDYRICLRDGRLGHIRIRKIVSTNGALHVQVLFEGASPLRSA